MTKKYYKTTIIFEVLSDASVDGEELVDIIRECDSGNYSGDIKAQIEEVVTDDHMSHLLEAQRSSPEFLLGDGWYAKKELEKVLFAFETAGSRSVELAERIDELREQIKETE